MKCFRLIIIGVVPLFVALQTAAQQTASQASPVQVVEVKKILFAPTVEVIGTIHSRNNVGLTAGVVGRLEFVAEPGSYVLSGEEVARIDPLTLTLQKAEQQAQIKRAIINQNYLKRELSRLQDLRQTNSASVFQLEQIQSQFDLAEADLEIAQLRLKQIDDQLSRTSIKAPFSGVVSERFREAGSEVNRSELLVTLVDVHNLEGRLTVPVKYLRFVRDLESVRVTIDGHQVDASIKAFIPAIDMRSQSFELRVSMPVSNDEQWASGQLITAILPAQAPQESLTVHRDALILRQDGTFVVVVDNENKAKRHKVEVGKGQDEWVSVKSSVLHDGDKVVTRGAERLQDGQLVAINKNA